MHRCAPLASGYRFSTALGYDLSVLRKVLSSGENFYCERTRAYRNGKAAAYITRRPLQKSTQLTPSGQLVIENVPQSPQVTVIDAK